MIERTITLEEHMELQKKHLIALNKIIEFGKENQQLREDIKELIAEKVSKYDPDWKLE